MAKNCASGVLAALTYAAFGANEAHADGRFGYSPFSNSASTAPKPAMPTEDEQKRGFDSQAFERGLKAIKEVASPSIAKKV